MARHKAPRLAAALACLVLAQTCLAQPAADRPVILFGQSAALSGPASELGQAMRQGLVAALAEANRNGGVHGHTLQLESLDDRYEPQAAIANTRKLIDEYNVFALIGATGTPTAVAAQPIAQEAGVPYIAPFTGAEFLRDARARPNVINLRASYYQETEEMVERINKDLGVKSISIIYQNDSFGRTGATGLQNALDRRGLTMAEEVFYTRNTEAVKTGLLDLRRADAEAVAIIGAYKPAATLIHWARRLEFNPYFINISFVGSTALARELGANGAGVYVTQVVPLPSDDSIPVVAEYRKALKATAPNVTAGFISLEGYLAGRLAVEGLRLAGRNPTKQGFLRALQNAGKISLSGFELEFGEGDNQGSDQVYLTRINSRGQFSQVRRMSRQ